MVKDTRSSTRNTAAERGGGERRPPIAALKPCLAAASASAVFLQANTQIAYLKAIRVTLDAALSIRNFASQVVERHNKPEVEARYEHTHTQTDRATD